MDARKLKFAAVGVLLGAALSAGSAFAFGGRHRHGGAMALCIGVMTPAQRANLHTTLGGAWAGLRADYKNVHAAKMAITHDILYGASVTTDEATLAQAESKLQSDKDGLAAQVCKNVSNIAAVQTLFGQLQSLHEQAHGDFSAAREAQTQQ